MLTRAADYALRAALTLAGQAPGGRMRLSELASACDVPPAFLYKILSSLARKGLLAAHRGVAGGYELTRRARNSSVLDVVEAADGLPLLNACVAPGACQRVPVCPAHPVWRQAQARMREVLAGAHLADLAPVGAAAARPARACDTIRQRPGGGQRRPAPGPGSRRSRGTHPKRMGNR